jgi:hypothetical protein
MMPANAGVYLLQTTSNAENDMHDTMASLMRLVKASAA